MRSTHVISLIQTKIRKLDNRASEDIYLIATETKPIGGTGVGEEISSLH